MIIDCDSLLLHFDGYIDSIDLHYYKEAQEVLTYIQEKTIMVVSGITSFMIDKIGRASCRERVSSPV